MKNTIIIVISILILIFILTQLIFPLIKSNNYNFSPTEVKITESASQSICNNLNETDCLNNANCYLNYGPSSSITSDIKFNGCALLTSEQKKQVEVEKQACKDKDGQWERERFTAWGKCSEL